MAVYHLYVDDSGNRAYSEARSYGASGVTRHFVYGAHLMSQDEASAFVPSLKELKVLTFGTTDVEVKSNWLRIPKEAKAHYLDPFGVTQEQLDKFVDDYYQLIKGSPIRFLGSVVDKLHMQEKYAQPWYPHTMAYEALMQRAVQAVPAGSSLAVMMDNVSGKTSNQTDYQGMIHAHHERLRKFGSSLVKTISFACLDRPVRFLNSASSDLIQVADVAAYNLFRQFRDHGENWENSTGQGSLLPMYPYFERIAGKFHRSPEGRVQGFGIVKCPLLKRVPWSVVKDEGK